MYKLNILIFWNYWRSSMVCNVLLIAINQLAFSLGRIIQQQSRTLTEWVVLSLRTYVVQHAKIWQWAEERNLWLYASYISSDNNTIADQESRKLPPLETEWSLSGAAFHTIITTISVPEIDLFASYANFKCEKYVSWKRDPGAVMIDAFTISWKNLNFYAFPPFSLILRVLNKIINEKATGIVVVPHWPTQVWFPLFSKLIASEPIIFSSTPDLITSPYSSAAHPLKITLVAARLSGTLFH